MPNESNALGNKLNRITLALAGAKSYSKDLPKEAIKATATLDKLAKSVNDLNAKQEKTKQDLARITAQLAEAVKQAEAERARIIRFAEATFGPRDSRLKEFRPVTEGRAAQPKVKKAPK